MLYDIVDYYVIDKVKEDKVLHRGYNYLDLAEEVLKKEKREMSISEIWAHALKMGLDKKLISIGKTPKKTLSASIRRHLGNAKHVQFKQTSKKPSLYYLKD